MSCRFDHYFTAWLVDQRWFESALAAYEQGLIGPDVLKGKNVLLQEYAREGVLQPQLVLAEDGSQIQRLETGPNGIAILPMMGHMMKQGSSFGGCSTVACRRLIRQAVRSDNVNGLMLYVDSPGGSVPGTAELAEEVARARKTIPVRAHVEDTGASAAYWVASQAESITCNKMGEVGSIGCVAAISDSSKMAEAQGVKVHVISTGPHKGAGVPGSPVTDEQLAVFQEQVHDVNAHFLDAVRAARGFNDEQLAAASDGRVFIAEKARDRGLIDGVSSFEDAVDDFAASIEPSGPAPGRNRRVRMRALEIETS